MKRTTEFVLGLIGGIFGFIGAFIALMIGGVDAAFNETGSSEITALGWAAVFLSVLAIVGAVLVRSRSKLGGIFMVIAGVGGVIAVFMFYLLPAVLLLIGGLMGIFKRDPQQQKIRNEEN